MRFLCKVKFLSICTTLVMSSMLVSCSTRSAQAQYPQPTVSPVKPSTDFCDERSYPGEGEELQVKPCPPIECDKTWNPERCVVTN